MRELYIIYDRLILVPLRVDWISCGEDRGSGVELTDYTRLRYRKRLLLLK